MTEPTVMFEVAVWDDNESPGHRALFFDRELAEAYRAALPGAELDEVPVETEAPTLATVHYLSKYVATRDGMSVLSLGGVNTNAPARHTTNRRWSHEMRTARANWTHSDHHVAVGAYDLPDLKHIEVTALDEAVGRRALAAAEQQLKAEAAVRAIADGGAP